MTRNVKCEQLHRLAIKTPDRVFVSRGGEGPRHVRFQGEARTNRIREAYIAWLLQLLTP